jgi:hypothetical protein
VVIISGILALSMGKIALAAEIESDKITVLESITLNFKKLKDDVTNELWSKIDEDNNLSVLPYFDCYLGIFLVTNQPQTYEIRNDLVKIYSDYAAIYR